jgi:histidyl-tRNA synthetase
MSTKKSIYKPGPIRGFPEWLPEERLVEQRWFDHIRRVFESYGYCNIETPSVEELDVLTAKGEVDKEIYVIERLHKDEGDKSEARLALHFDQTVPMARYVAMRFNDLVFPFKRYQMQRVWRGERPQMGRMREFYQCDIDIINVDNLPLSFDAEVASVMYEVLEGLNIGKVQVKISNRKILSGLMEIAGIDDETQKNKIFRVIDKIDKVSPSILEEELKNNIKNQTAYSYVQYYLDKAKSLKALASNQHLTQQADYIENLIGDKEFFNNQTFRLGVQEICTVLKSLDNGQILYPEHAFVVDLSIVRGLDYYTGTVYETQLLDVPEFTGSVCSGGRYDDLAGSYINKHLPGVGISLGFSRLFDVIRQTRPDLLGIGPKGPADVLMTVPENESDRPLAYEAARILRKQGVKVEMYHAPKKIGDQLKYAAKKNLPYVWFVRDGKHEVKNLATQAQEAADPNTWRG